MSQQLFRVPRSGILTLPEPNVPGLLDLLPDEGGIQSLPLSRQGSDLEILVLGWDSYDEAYARWTAEGYTDLTMEFYCTWEGETVGTMVSKAMTPSAANFFPVSLKLPAHLLIREGIWALGYQAKVVNLDNEELSFPKQIRIDRTAPNFGNPCPLRSDNVRLIDAEYLENNEQQAIIFLDRWADIRLQDRAGLYLIPEGQAGIPPEHTVEIVVDALNLDLDPFPVSIPATLLRDGQFRLVGMLEDRSGNIGRESASLPVEVRLGDASALPDPVVPAAADGLVDLQDARRPATIEISEIAHAVSGDTLQAYWNERPLALVVLAQVMRWPVSIPVPWATITAEGFVGPLPRAVRYELLHDGSWQRSRVIQVEVDLRVAGPDPEGPGEINPRLFPVVVKGRTADNVIVREDVEAGQSVTVKVRLYDNPRAGEFLDLYWGRDPETDENAQVVARYAVTGVEVPGQEVEFSPVSLSVILDVGDGPAIPVFYRTFNGVNLQRANATPVRVDTAVRPPIGQLAELKVETPPLSLSGWINCDSRPWLGIPLIVPGAQADVQAGDSVELRWQMFRTQRDGNEPTPPNLPPPPPAQPLMPAPEYLPAVNITADGAANGQVLLMNEFTRLIFNVFLKAKGAFKGYARVGYRLTKADGRAGEALLAWLPIDIQRTSGLVCSASGDVRVNEVIDA